MKWEVLYHDRPVGWCDLQEDGLYWKLTCRCQAVSGRIERLYWNGRCLGVLERQGEQLTLERRFSKVSAPGIPSETRLPTLEREELWQGSVLDCPMPPCIRTWKNYGSLLSFPFSDASPCPCPPLVCFFTVRDGFWLMKLDEDENPFFDFD